MANLTGLKTKILLLNGKGIPVEEPSEEGGEPVYLTYAMAMTESLMSSEEKLSGVAALKRQLLAERIHNCDGTLELTTSEIATIQSAVESRYGRALVILAPVFKLLEGIEGD